MRWGTVAVTGESMLPTLRPGDWLLIRRRVPVRAGDIVVAHHPDEPDLLIVKRAVHRAGRGWWLEGDNRHAPGRRDSRDFGAVADELVIARAVARYRPHPVLLRRRPPHSTLDRKS